MEDFFDVFNKYTQAGPSYHYYPTTLAFHDNVKQAVIVKQLQTLKGRKLNLHLFFPFCRDPDCHSTEYQIELKDDTQIDQYITQMKREIMLYKQHIGQVKLVAVHFAGNEVSLLRLSQLKEILKLIESLSENGIRKTDLSLSINSRMFEICQLPSLKRMGVNRLRIPLLSFDYELKLGAETVHSYEQAQDLIRVAKEVGFDSIDVELMYGLSSGSYQGMRKTINSLIDLGCEQIRLTQYFHRPYFFKFQKMLNSAQLPSAKENYVVFKMCIDELLAAGYSHIGMNCFVSKLSELNPTSAKQLLGFNHMGYTLNHVNSVVSVGASSISKVDGLFYQSFIDLDGYYSSVTDGFIPAYKQCTLTTDQLFRKKIIKSLITSKRFDIDQTNEKLLNMLEYISETCCHLYEMEKDGLVKLSKKSIQVTDLGQYFLKSICALFDLSMRELLTYTDSKN